MADALEHGVRTEAAGERTSGTFSTRTSPAPYMTVARMSDLLLDRQLRTALGAGDSPTG